MSNSHRLHRCLIRDALRSKLEAASARHSSTARDIVRRFSELRPVERMVLTSRLKEALADLAAARLELEEHRHRHRC